MSIISRSTGENGVKSLAAAVAVLALSSCGGGGGRVSSIPAPLASPPSPAPAPAPAPPPPAVAVISAPAPGSAAATPPPVLASTGGATFATAASDQTFPLLQTTLVLTPTSISPDSAINAAGGRASVSAGSLTINTGPFSGTPISSGYANLDWTRVGYWSTGGTWDYWETDFVHRGVFVAGFETPAGAIPNAGSATYTGLASGSVFYPVAQGSGATLCDCGETRISGTASFTADFGNRSLSGALTGMTVPHPWDDNAPPVPWNDVAFSAIISGNKFSGGTSVTANPGGAVSLGSNAIGTLEGKFFGPNAQEAGAVWTLFDGTSAAVGTLTGKRP